MTKRQQRKAFLEKRNERIRLRFKSLYDVERKRIDDVYAQVSDEFCLSEKWIHKIVFEKQINLI